jgi:riboflavin kinase / FMN adenylyltransferase
MSDPVQPYQPYQPYQVDQLPLVGPAAVTMGVFDGLHVGHAALMVATRAAARAFDAHSVALVFDPHPDEVLKPGTRVERLAPLAENLARISAAGIEHPLPVRFDEALRMLSAEEFMAALQPSLELRALVMSDESAFGRGRGGTVARMRELGMEQGFRVVTVERVEENREIVSSNRVRMAIAAGDLEGVARMGVRPYLEGTVVEGDHRGRELGYPTANLSFDYLPALPALGIYAGLAGDAERGVGPGHPALVSVGVRPTFHDHGQVLAEVHLLDWSGDLYDTRLSVVLTARLRDEFRFETVPELVAQMRRDEQEARAALRDG